MSEAAKHRPVTAVIKGDGSSSNGGGFSRIHINGAKHHPDDVARAVECFPDMLAALKASRPAVVALSERHGEVSSPLLEKIDAAISRAESTLPADRKE